jgi:hypothetical protein
LEAAPLRVIARRKHRDVEAPFLSFAGLGLVAFAVVTIVACVAFMAGRG